MLALVSIAGASSPEAEFWASEAAVRLTSRLIAELEVVPGVDRIVLLTPVPLPHGVRTGRARVHFVPGLALPDAPGLGPLCARLRAALNAVGEDANEGAIMVDGRSVFLGRKDFARALELSAVHPGELIASVRECQDHPCQCKRFLRTLDSGTLDFEPGRDELLVESCDGAVVEGTFAVSQLYSKVVVRGGNLKARLHRLDESGRLALKRRGRAEGVAYAVFAPVHGGEFDVARPVEPIPGLWALSRRGLPARAGDGAEILGRQDFPPLFEINGSLVAASRLPKNFPNKAVFLRLRRGPVTVRSHEDFCYGKALLRLACDTLFEQE